MSDCTDDSDLISHWCGGPSYVGGPANTGDCVSWDLLTIGGVALQNYSGLRLMWNQIYDLLAQEGRAVGVQPYGCSGQQNIYAGKTLTQRLPHAEQTAPLATVNGTYSIKLDSAGTVQEVYFTLLDPSVPQTQSYLFGDPQGITQRMAQIPGVYTYDNTTPFGPWIVYLTDPSFGCTGFIFDSSLEARNPYYKVVTYKGKVIESVDGSTYSQCLWKSSGECAEGAIDEDICNLSIDWRDGDVAKTKFTDIAKYFVKVGNKAWAYNGPDKLTAKFGCPQATPAPLNPEPTIFSIIAGANGPLTATAYLTEEGSTPTSGGVHRWVKWITVGPVQGFVTQAIRAVHLTDIRRQLGIAFAGDGATVRGCYVPKCVAVGATSPSGPDFFTFGGEEVAVSGSASNSIALRPQAGDGSTGPPGPCKLCLEGDPAVGSTICACQWNELFTVMSFILYYTCTCTAGTYGGKTLLGFGDLEDCDCKSPLGFPGFSGDGIVYSKAVFNQVIGGAPSGGGAPTWLSSSFTVEFTSEFPSGHLINPCVPVCTSGVCTGTPPPPGNPGVVSDTLVNSLCGWVGSSTGAPGPSPLGGCSTCGSPPSGPPQSCTVLETWTLSNPVTI